MKLSLSLRAKSIPLLFCGFAAVCCLFVQPAHAQSHLAAPVAMSADPAPQLKDKKDDPKNQENQPDPPKPTDGIAVKGSDCAAWGGWLTWVQYRPVSMGAGVAFTALVILGLTAGKPQRLLLGQDNRYSNSKCQMALWFFIVISAYLTVFLVRLKSCVVGGIGIPPHLLLLSGFSAVTFVGAKAITTSKVNNAQEMGLVTPKPTALPEGTSTVTVASVGNVVAVAVSAASSAVGFRSLKFLIGDLTTNDGLKIQDPTGGPPIVTQPTMDIGDTQMIVIALIAVLTYLVIVYNYLGTTNFSSTAGVVLPDVDSTLLSLFGLGQGAYLSKKAVGNAGES